MRFLQPYDSETVKWLKIIENSSKESNMTRNRALAIRLSFDKFEVKQIAKICNVTMETIYTWFNNWEKSGFDSLLVRPGQGRKALIQPSEYEEVLKIVDENPKQLKTTLSEIEKRLGKKISVYTLKRIIRKKKVGGVSENL